MSASMEAYERVLAGETPAQVAKSLGVHGNVIHGRLQSARRLLARREAMAEGRDVNESEECFETPREARARVARELADGKRCTHKMRKGPCALLLPCADHGQ